MLVSNINRTVASSSLVETSLMKTQTFWAIEFFIWNKWWGKEDGSVLWSSWVVGCIFNFCPNEILKVFCAFWLGKYHVSAMVDGSKQLQRWIILHCGKVSCGDSKFVPLFIDSLGIGEEATLKIWRTQYFDRKKKKKLDGSTIHQKNLLNQKI